MKEERSYIKFRIDKSSKEKWKALCLKRGFTLTSLIIDSVEGKILDDERRGVLAFIEKQDNIFAKIENNINQFAKVANTNKMVSDAEMKEFNKTFVHLLNLKEEQIQIFKNIYKLIAKRNDS